MDNPEARTSEVASKGEAEPNDEATSTSEAGSGDKRECKPICSFEELMAWEAPEVPSQHTPIRTRSVPMSSSPWKIHRPESTPRTIVCHDLKGGYLDDRFEDGTYCDQQPYVFFSWQYLDAFIYFSHNFITIPPRGWVSAAHTNGVLILGTIITEWEKGTALCSQMLADEASIDAFVRKCKGVMADKGFDGWLVNIENEICEKDVHSMVILLGKLTKAMKEVNPKAMVLWYDSVTCDGSLLWQNELNHKNWSFFEACDGIFLNYVWKPEGLQASKEMLVRENVFDNRRFDIYVGVDVFGRGCLGGGGFNTCEAAKVIRQEGMSLAIFAPSWTYEVKGEEEDFLTREHKFWGLLDRYLYFRGPRLSTSESGEDCKFDLRFSLGCKQDPTNTTTWWLNLADQDFQARYYDREHEQVLMSADPVKGMCMKVRLPQGLDSVVCVWNGELVNEARKKVLISVSLDRELEFCLMSSRDQTLGTLQRQTSYYDTAREAYVSVFGLDLPENNQDFGTQSCTPSEVTAEDRVYALFMAIQNSPVPKFEVQEVRIRQTE